MLKKQPPHKAIILTQDERERVINFMILLAAIDKRVNGKSPIKKKPKSQGKIKTSLQHDEEPAENAFCIGSHLCEPFLKTIAYVTENHRMQIWLIP